MSVMDKLKAAGKAVAKAGKAVVDTAPVKAVVKATVATGDWVDKQEQRVWPEGMDKGIQNVTDKGCDKVGQAGTWTKEKACKVWPEVKAEVCDKASKAGTKVKETASKVGPVCKEGYACADETTRRLVRMTLDAGVKVADMTAEQRHALLLKLKKEAKRVPMAKIIENKDLAVRIIAPKNV